MKRSSGKKRKKGNDCTTGDITMWRGAEEKGKRMDSMKL